MRTKLLLAGLFFCGALPSQILTPFMTTASGGCCSYYVDPVAGSDANTGTAASPFKTINHTNGLPGRIGLKAGGVYRLFSAPRQSLNDYWDLTGSPGNTVTDLSGNGNTLTNCAATHAATSTANGYVFAGGQCATAASQTTTAVTIIVVMNPSVVANQFTFCQSASTNLCALYDYSTTPGQAFEAYSTVALRTQAGTYSLPAAGTKWVDLAYAYSSGASLAGYLNGVQYYSASIAVSKTLDASGWIIGSYATNNSTAGLTGTIAAVMIYNRVLSAAEVAKADAYIRPWTPLGPAVVGPRPPANGLVSRYRYDTLLGAAKQGITVWPDTIGSHHMQQAAANNQPCIRTTGGKNFASFFDSDCNTSAPSYMTLAGSPSWDRSNVEVYFIWRPAGGEGTKITFNDSAGWGSNEFLGWNTSGLAYTGINGLLTSDTGTISGASVYPDQTGTTMSAFTSSGSGVTFFAGSHSSTATALSSKTVTPSTFGVNSSNSFVGDLAEVLVYGPGRDNGNYAEVNAYAHANYTIKDSWSNLVVFDGNSITSGNGFAVNWPNITMDSLGGTWGGPNLGIAGKTTEQLSAMAATKVDPLFDATKTRNVLVIWEGTNSLFLGDTAAQALSAMASYVAARRAAHPWTKIVYATILPRSNSGTPGTFEADRQTCNTALRSNPGGIYGDILADVGNDATIGQAGQSSNTTYFLDLVHLTPAGYAIVAGYFTAAINSVP